MTKIAYLTGTRADYGLMRSVLKIIDQDPQFELLLFVTGIHILPQFGKTINEIEKDFKITAIIDETYEKDNRLSMVKFIGKCLVKIGQNYKRFSPNAVLVLGDRGEQLASAIAAHYLNIPIFHLHGGDKSGTVDNQARFTISQLADYHLVASKNSTANLKNVGIPKNKIFIVGAPGLDEIKQLGRLPKKNQIVILQHPSEDENKAGTQIKTTLDAALSFNLPVIVIFPNADAGGRKMIKIINEFAKKNKNIKIFPSIPRSDFLKLLTQSKVLIGNSSAGIIETPTLKLPTVNIGERQNGREKANNVIDTDYNYREIIQAIKRCLYDNTFIKSLESLTNPYGQGDTGPKIIKLLKEFQNGKI